MIVRVQEPINQDGFLLTVSQLETAEVQKEASRLCMPPGTATGCKIPVSTKLQMSICKHVLRRGEVPLGCLQGLCQGDHVASVFNQQLVEHAVQVLLKLRPETLNGSRSEVNSYRCWPGVFPAACQVTRSIMPSLLDTINLRCCSLQPHLF